MIAELSTRSFVTAGIHDLALYPVDGQKYAVFINGCDEAPFARTRDAHHNAVMRLTVSNGFSEKERSVVCDLAKRSVETVDFFQPEGNE